MLKIIARLEEIRSEENGATVTDMLVGMMLTTLLVTLATFSLIGVSEGTAKTHAALTPLASHEVAIDLKAVYGYAGECIANYDAQEDKFGTYSSGNYLTPLLRADINTCLSTKVGSGMPTLHYEIKRSGENELCIAGYDTDRDTDTYTATKPYVYMGPNMVIKQGREYSCVITPEEGMPFDWQEMRIK